MKVSESVFTAPGVAEVVESPLQGADEFHFLADALCSGISWGSESLFLRGKVDPSGDGLASIQDRKSGGNGSFPVRYGYSHVSRITSVGSPDQSLRPGVRIFSFSHHKTAVRLRREQAWIIPDSLPDARATLTANMETALTLVTDAESLVGARVLVVGLGVVGQLCCSLLQHMPLRSLTAVDCRPERRALAKLVLEPGKAEICDQAQAGQSAWAPHVVFELSGSVEGLKFAVESVEINGEIVAGSWYGDELAGIPGTSFHKKRIRLHSSQVSGMSPRQQYLFSKNEKMQLAMDLLCRNPGLDRLITHVCPFAESPRLYRDMLRNPERFGHCVLRYSH